MNSRVGTLVVSTGEPKLDGHIIKPTPTRKNPANAFEHLRSTDKLQNQTFIGEAKKNTHRPNGRQARKKKKTSPL